MSHKTCCVNGCDNKGYNSSYLFYAFPLAKHKTVQRQKWIEAVSKINSVGTEKWIPKKNDVICSAHFLGGKKSDEVVSPSYAPTIFSTTPTSKDIQAYNRHVRFMQRILKKRNASAKLKSGNRKAIKTEDSPSTTVDRACQVFIFKDDDESKPSKETCVCIRYVYSNHADCEIQTDITY